MWTAWNSERRGPTISKWYSEIQMQNKAKRLRFAEKTRSPTLIFEKIPKQSKQFKKILLNQK